MFQQVGWLFTLPPVPSQLVAAFVFLVQCVLLLNQIIVLLGVFFVTPSTPAYFAWFTRTSIWPVLSEKDAPEGSEIFAYLIYSTIFLTSFLWGLVPLLSVRMMLSSWVLGCISVVMSCMVLAFLILTIRTMFVTWKWWKDFQKISQLTVVARHCQAISIFSFLLLFVGCTSSLGFYFYFSIHGTPALVTEILEDMQRLLCVLAGADSPSSEKVDL